MCQLLVVSVYQVLVVCDCVCVYQVLVVCVVVTQVPYEADEMGLETDGGRRGGGGRGGEVLGGGEDVVTCLSQLMHPV